MQRNWDIFCKIIDNFGDIGVCWRLAKQLQLEHGLQIRLWVDDLITAQKIIPSLNTKLNQQVTDGISISKWHAVADFSQAANVVIETFACELPSGYVAAMVRQKSKWINLEYLSAEPWVDDFHGKPSPQANGLTRHFYFPGFSEKTGGLIRENQITARLQNAINPNSQAGEGVRQHGRGAEHINFNAAPFSNLSPTSERETKVDGMLEISLFCYPFAPIAELFTALQANNHAVLVNVPQSSILPNIAQFFGKKSVKVGDKLTQNNLTIKILPFLSQADYDQLLRVCNLNFVRGEDSWLRAIWAGKPFIWQPYSQDENAHMKKLDAFLDYFYADFDYKKSVFEAHRYWSAGQLSNAVLNDYLDDLINICTYTQNQSSKQMAQNDLASKLVIFCDNLPV